MKHRLFCCLLSVLVAGCLARVHSQKGNSNSAVNSVEWPFGNTNSSWVNANAFDRNANLAGYANAGANMVANATRWPGKRYASEKRVYDVCGNPMLRCKSSGDFILEDLPISIPGH